VTGIVLALVITSLSAYEMNAQARIQLKRTNKTSVPFSVMIFGGYNGIMDPSEKLQDMFEGTISTSWGGLLVGIAGLVTIDTLWKPLSAGAEFTYERMGQRYLAKRPEVRYPDEETQVESDEYLRSYGAQALIGYDIHERLQLILGAGFQHIYSVSDVEGKVTGLFAPVTIATAMAGANVGLLKYDHGSIDASFRCLKGFGEWGSIQFQSTLTFSFDF
jgi:hypothetical protein